MRTWTLPLPALLLSLPAAAIPATHDGGPLAVPVEAAVLTRERESVLFDERAGEVWAVGSTYKAGFDRQGAQFVPFLGSDAPRNFPVRLRPARVACGGAQLAFDGDAAPERDGQSVVFERGAFQERYDLRLDSMEQTFLVRERPGTGLLVLELEVETDLVGSADGADLVFSGERGGVRYSGAIAIDARGRRVAAPTRFCDGRIEIEVAAADLGGLCFPLLVDPVITTFGIGGSIVTGGRYPDAAYDPGTNLWCVVFEHPFSASDDDVYSFRLDHFGSVVWESVIDTSTVRWSGPRVAVHRGASQMLVVASTGATGSRQIQGRLQDVFLPSTGSVLTFNPAGADHAQPDVGGDGSTDAAGLYCVVWARVNSASDTDIVRRMLRTDGTFATSAAAIAGPIGTFETAPSISNRTGDGSQRRWTVAWHRWLSFSDSDLYAALIGEDGALDVPTFALDTTINNTRNVGVSSPNQDGQVLVAYARGSSGNTRIWGYVLDGSTIVRHANLSVLSGGAAGDNFVNASADSDGADFVVTQVRQADAGYWIVSTSTFTLLPDRLAVSEAALEYASMTEAPWPHVAARGPIGEDLRRSLIVHHTPTTDGIGSVQGAIYGSGRFTSFCEPGANGVIACPCGNAPANPAAGCANSANGNGARLLSEDGWWAPIAVAFRASGLPPSALCLLVQRNGYQASAAFGDGVSCVGGLALRLGVRTASSGQALWPMPGEEPIVTQSAALGDPIQPGAVRYYFVYYRDPAPAFACSATFNTTQALRVRY